LSKVTDVQRRDPKRAPYRAIRPSLHAVQGAGQRANADLRVQNCTYEAPSCRIARRSPPFRAVYNVAKVSDVKGHFAQMFGFY